MAIRSAGTRKITKVNLRVGDLSGVAAESLTMYCDLIFQEKQPAGNVETAIERVAAAFRCSCGEPTRRRNSLIPVPGLRFVRPDHD